jgi:hypothetical protein
MVPAYTLLNMPIVLFFITVAVLWGAAWLGVFLCRGTLEQAERDDFGIILGATLTLLGLIIGFSFSMATSRYDQRKNYEEAEANAIGTEYVRAALLSGADAANVQGLLKAYLNERLLFYTPADAAKLDQINADTSATQTKLWAAVRAPALAKPTPVNALVLAGMNDVLNSQGYTQAAWWNRIPRTAWGLMGLIAIVANILVGYGSHRAKGRAVFLLIVPVLASIAFVLIADLDSPRGGLVHIRPQNLSSLSQSLKAP